MVAFSVHQQNSPRMVAKLKPCGVGLFDRKKNRGQAKNPAQKPFFARKLQIWSLHRNSKPFTSIDSTSKSFTSVTKWPVLIFWIFKSSSLTWLWLFSGSICAKRLSWRFSHHKKSDRCWKKTKTKTPQLPLCALLDLWRCFFWRCWKTAVATLISINLKALKPAIQFAEKKNATNSLCFPGWLNSRFSLLTFSSKFTKHTRNPKFTEIFWPKKSKAKNVCETQKNERDELTNISMLAANINTSWRNPQILFGCLSETL